MMRTFLAIAFSLLACTGFAQKTKTIELDASMRCENCGKHYQEALSKVDGVQSVTPDVKSQKVTVVYDAKKTSKKDLQSKVAAMGSKMGKSKDCEKGGKDSECCEEKNAKGGKAVKSMKKSGSKMKKVSKKIDTKTGATVGA